MLAELLEWGERNRDASPWDAQRVEGDSRSGQSVGSTINIGVLRIICFINYLYQGLSGMAARDQP